MQKINNNLKKINKESKKTYKSEKGITLVALVTTIIIIAIISVPVALDIVNIGEVKKFTKFKDDLVNLKESVSRVYSTDTFLNDDNSANNSGYTNEGYIGPKYTGDLGFLNNKQDGYDVKNPNDDENYYIINPNQIEQLLSKKYGVSFDNLNYGDSNYLIKEDPNYDKNSITDDVYIINNRSRTIYYVQGYDFDNVTYYRYQESFTKIEKSEMPTLKIGDDVTYKKESSYNLNQYYSGQGVDKAVDSDENKLALSSSNSSPYSIINWKVFDIDESNKTVELISAIPTSGNITLGNSENALGAANGYSNAVKILNDACSSLYSDKDRGIKARSINEDDIIKVGAIVKSSATDNETNTEKKEEKNRIEQIREQYKNEATIQYLKQIASNLNTTNLSETGAYITNKLYPQIYSNEADNVINDKKVNEGLQRSAQTEYYTGVNSSSTSIHPYQTKWNATFTKDDFSYLNNKDGDTYYKLLISDSLSSYSPYWVATRSIDLKTSECAFDVECIENGKISTKEIYTSSGKANAISLKLRPIITVSVDKLENISEKSWRIE